MNIALGTYDHQLSFFTDNSKGISREDYEGFLDFKTFEDVDRHSRIEYSFLLEEIEFLCLAWNRPADLFPLRRKSQQTWPRP